VELLALPLELVEPAEEDEPCGEVELWSGDVELGLVLLGDVELWSGEVELVPVVLVLLPVLLGEVELWSGDVELVPVVLLGDVELGDVELGAVVLWSGVVELGVVELGEVLLWPVVVELWSLGCVVVVVVDWVVVVLLWPLWSGVVEDPVPVLLCASAKALETTRIPKIWTKRFMQDSPSVLLNSRIFPLPERYLRAGLKMQNCSNAKSAPGSSSCSARKCWFRWDLLDEVAILRSWRRSLWPKGAWMTYRCGDRQPW
jgi:hypothetical protein